MKSNLCSNCIVGKNSIELDSNAPFCPYIGMYKNDKCPMYVELKEKPKTKVDDESKKIKFWLV